jgi:hypothetical protein
MMFNYECGMCKESIVDGSKYECILFKHEGYEGHDCLTGVVDEGEVICSTCANKIEVHLNSLIKKGVN